MNRQKKEIQKKAQKLLMDLTPIDSFFGQWRFLSNFYPCEVLMGGFVYSSVEAAYQAAKTLEIDKRAAFLGLTANEAKVLGNLIEVREDWDDVKDNIMFGLLKQKFAKQEFKLKLFATLPRPLVEGNRWHDTYWGVCNGCKKKGSHSSIGLNKLGEFLMEIRAQIGYGRHVV